MTFFINEQSLIAELIPAAVQLASSHMVPIFTAGKLVPSKKNTQSQFIKNGQFFTEWGIKDCKDKIISRITPQSNQVQSPLLDI